MLAAPSLQFEYTACFSGDPALDLPEIPDFDRSKATSDELAAIEKLVSERVNKLRVAQQTGNWPAITKQGKQPTIFRFQPVGGSAVRWWMGQSMRERLTPVEDIELMFRLALVGVDNLDKVELKIDRSGKFPLVSTASMDQLYALPVGLELVMELGEYAARRATRGVDPLS